MDKLNVRKIETENEQFIQDRIRWFWRTGFLGKKWKSKITNKCLVFERSLVQFDDGTKMTITYKMKKHGKVRTSTLSVWLAVRCTTRGGFLFLKRPRRIKNDQG